MTAPATDAPFSDKMTYYRTQHTSRGARLTHMVGTPVIAAGIPLLTYQLTGVIHVCEQYGELLARRSQRKAARRAAVRVPA
jgi:hypothetical protein